MNEPLLPDSPEEAVLDLLIKQATEGLTPDEQRELDVLDAATTARELQAIERAVAAATIAGLRPLDVPPPDVLARLQRLAEAQQLRPSASVHVLPPRPPVVRRGASGWWAAAACLILAAFGWLRAPGPVGPALPAPPAEPPVAVVVPPPAVPESIEEQRAKLLAQATSVKVQLGATKDPAAAGVTGDVVWDPQTQSGYLHFVGLAANDPQLRQYQAWVFDAERDQRYPVDAGVFDVPADAHEVFIPIHVRVPVRTAAAFAVTVEKAGGSVVSGREHVVVLGKPG